MYGFITIKIIYKFIKKNIKPFTLSYFQLWFNIETINDNNTLTINLRDDI